MLVKTAQSSVHASPGNAKMNCGCWGLPTSTCNQHFPRRKDSTCHPSNCYAQRNHYLFPNVRQTQLTRLSHAWNDPHFITALSVILGRQRYFRFFDSGDFPDFGVMRKILRACELAPRTKVHIPTKQYDLVKLYSTIYPIPKNVVLRVGMWHIDPDPDEVQQFADEFHNIAPIAIVSKEAHTKPYIVNGVKAHICPATHPGQQRCIIDCDYCWHRENEVVIFPWH